MIGVIAFFFEQCIAVFRGFAFGNCGVYSRNCGFNTVFVNVRCPIN